MVVMGQEFLSSSVELRLQGVRWVGPVVSSWSSGRRGLTVSERPCAVMAGLRVVGESKRQPMLFVLSDLALDVQALSFPPSSDG